MSLNDRSLDDQIAELQARISAWHFLSSNTPTIVRFFFAMNRLRGHSGNPITFLISCFIVVGLAVALMTAITFFEPSISPGLFLVCLVLSFVFYAYIDGGASIKVVTDELLNMVAQSPEIPLEQKKEIAKWVDQYSGQLKWYFVLKTKRMQGSSLVKYKGSEMRCGATNPKR